MSTGGWTDAARPGEGSRTGDVRAGLLPGASGGRRTARHHISAGLASGLSGQGGGDDDQRVGPGRTNGRSLGRHDHRRSEEHTSELQSLMRISYAVFCLKKKNKKKEGNKKITKK